MDCPDATAADIRRSFPLRVASSRLVIVDPDEPGRCVLCGWPHVHKHRLNPGRWGGSYDPDNVVLLCPNHHAAIHLLMAWYYNSVRRKRGRVETRDDERRLEHAQKESGLNRLWAERVKPIVIARLQAEGRWYPYVRTLPVERPGETRS